MRNYVYNKYDVEAAKMLGDFLPDKLFDAHMHISPSKDVFSGHNTLLAYYEDMAMFTGDRKLLVNAIPFPETKYKTSEDILPMSDFVLSQLDMYPENVCEVLVLPTDTESDIEKRITDKRICGLKCYHHYANRENTMQADIGEYLSEAVWHVANKKKMAITLHMVKDRALSDEKNLEYIMTMTKKYPDAKLILAHAARAFASWTAFDVVDKIAGYENIWYDFSSICEPTAMLYIVKKTGAERCMWGTDYPVAMFSGKAISLADGFYWINGSDIEKFAGGKEFKSWHVVSEEFMAMKQMCILADLSRKKVEDIFYNNAAMLFGR